MIIIKIKAYKNNVNNDQEETPMLFNCKQNGPVMKSLHSEKKVNRVNKYIARKHS